MSYQQFRILRSQLLEEVASAQAKLNLHCQHVSDFGAYLPNTEVTFRGERWKVFACEEIDPRYQSINEEFHYSLKNSNGMIYSISHSELCTTDMQMNIQSPGQPNCEGIGQTKEI